MAVPSYRSTSSVAGGLRTSCVITPPAGLADGDIMELHFYLESTAVTVTLPAGFTQKRLIQLSSGNIFRHYICWKRASGESGNYTITWGGSNIFCQAVMHAFSGCIATGDPYNTENGTFSNTTPIPNVSITTTVNECLLSWASCHWVSTTVSGLSGGGLTWTERYDPGDDVSAGTAPKTTAGAVTVSATNANTSDGFTAWVGALLPVPPGTAAVTGTLDGATEADVRAGGRTIVITLTDDTFIPS